MSLRREQSGARLAVEHFVFVLAPILLTIWVLNVLWAHDGHGEDFGFQYWVAGWRTLHGVSPYASLHAPINPSLAFPYPASTAVFFAPFALLSRSFSSDLFTAICIASPLVSLWILRVQDWRLYGMVLLLTPVVSGWQTANLTLLAGLGMAVLWRFRDREFLAGLTAAALISLKPFLWPLVLWLLATRRWRAIGYAIVVGGAIQLVSWAIVGFDQIHRFLRVTFSVTHTFRGWGYSLASFAHHLGAGPGLATAVAVAASALVAGALMAVGRRRPGITSFVLAVTLVLCASPIVWAHYFSLLVIPLAILRPNLTPAWACLLPLWACPLTNPNGWESDVALATFAGTTGLLLMLCEIRGGQSAWARLTSPQRLSADADTASVSVAAEA